MTSATVARSGLFRGRLSPEHLACWLLIAPAVGLLLLFYMAPLAQILLLSVTETDPRAPDVAFGNYSLLLSQPALATIIWRTLTICLTTTAIALVLGYAVAYVTSLSGRGQQSMILLAVLMTFWLSVLIRSFAWLILLREGGEIHSILSIFHRPLAEVGLVQGPLRLIRNETGVIIGMVHYMLPYAILPMLANMRGIDLRAVMAARSLGASRGQAFTRVFLPLSTPGIVASGVLVFVLTLGFFVTPAILGGGRAVMLAEYIWFSTSQTLRWGLSTMLATSLLVAVMAVLLLASRFVDVQKMYGMKS